MTHRMTTEIQWRDGAERFADAGGDELRLRVVGEGGECPVAVVEGVSGDRDWVPLHSHPWDELTYVLEGEIDFKAGDLEATGPGGTIVVLPRDVPTRFACHEARPGT